MKVDKSCTYYTYINITHISNLEIAFGMDSGNFPKNLGIRRPPYLTKQFQIMVEPTMLHWTYCNNLWYWDQGPL